MFFVPEDSVPPLVATLQRENAPLVPTQPPSSGWHLALRLVCSARLGIHDSEKQPHPFHAVDVWQTTKEK